MIDKNQIIYGELRIGDDIVTFQHRDRDELSYEMAKSLENYDEIKEEQQKNKDNKTRDRKAFINGYLKAKGSEAVFMKKDIRILWNCSDEAVSEISGRKTGDITELTVGYFPKEAPSESEWPMKLYDLYSFDTGNCESEWDQMTPIDIVLKFGLAYEYIDLATKKAALLELAKIEELREPIGNLFLLMGW